MIKIICIGKLKEELKKTELEYLKRISRFTKIEIKEIKEHKSQNINESMKKEAEKIRPLLSGFKIAMDSAGKQMSSEEFSLFLEKQTDLTFIIGSHVGIDEELKKETNLQLSLSKMTFPHQIARITLLEQIYRGYTIIKGMPYHK